MQRVARQQVMLATATCLLPLLLQLPPSLGIGFGISALVVAAASWRRALPATLRILLGIGVLLAVAAVSPGIGRDTACAMLAGMLALKPSETMTLRDGRSLVGFALFAPFATFLLDQGPLSLVLALAAVLLALLALQGLARDEADVHGADGTRWWSSSTGVLRLLALEQEIVDLVAPGQPAIAMGLGGLQRHRCLRALALLPGETVHG